MHGVMDCIEIQGFGTFCKICFASGCSVLCLYTHLQIFLGAVGYDFAEKLCGILLRALLLRKLLFT